MMKIGHILFPMDFSERCCAAVPFVASMARHYGSKITLLSIADLPSFEAYSEPGEPVTGNAGLVLNDLQARLDGALLQPFSGLDVKRAVDVGDPAELILDYAEMHAVDIVMMPTHGVGRFRQFLLGSVTAKVLHDAKCPVWTAAHRAEPHLDSVLPYRTILCAVDETPDCSQPLMWAAEFAADCGARLRLVHVFPGMANFPSAEYREDMRRGAMERMEVLFRRLGVRAPLTVSFGLVSDCVRDEAKHSQADLLVIGRGHIHQTLGRLRTHAYSIISQSPCPVVSV